MMRGMDGGDVEEMTRKRGRVGDVGSINENSLHPSVL